MPLAMAITDNGDGSGGAAIITGSAGGSANTVYYAPFTGMTTSGKWTLGGAMTGDGTVPLMLGKGYFLFQLLSNGTLGPVATRAFTNGDESVHYRCLQGCKTRILQLSMAGLDATKIKDPTWLPRAIDIDIAALPCIAISPPGFEIDVGMVTNQDDYLHPVIVAILVKQNQDSVANLPAVLKWREQILLAISNQRLPGVPENMWADPKPMNIVDPDSFISKGILLSVIGFGFHDRMLRGLT